MRLRALASALIALAALGGSQAAAAVTVPLNHAVRLPVAGSAASVVVGNPAVADVTVVDSHTVFVSGRSFGSTDVIVLDSLGRTLFSSDIEVAAPSRGRVAVYRGGARSDLSCDPACGSASVVTASGAAPAFGGSSAVSAASRAAALPSAIPNAFTNLLPGSGRPPFAGPH